MAFTFGGSSGSTPAPAPAGGGGFSFGFGAPAPAGDKPTFSFGGTTATTTTSTPAQAAPSFGSDSGVPDGKRRAPEGFSLGSSAPAPSVPTFGGTTSFGALAPAPTSNTAGSTTPAPAAPSFSFGGAPAAAAPSTAAPAAPSFSFGGAPAATTAPAPAGGFSFGSSTQSEVKKDDQAPAAGSFSFGAPAPAAPTTTAADKNDTAPAPAAGAFSFGGFAVAGDNNKKAGDSTTSSAAAAPPAAAAANTPVATSATTAGGGFSFGGASLGTPTVPGAAAAPQPPTTPGIPAPVDTPSKTSTTTPLPATAATQPLPSIPYQTMTVEGILNRFQKELEEDAVAFLDQTKRVCEFDAVVRDSQRALSQLASQTQRLLLEQEQVEVMLMGIDTFQTHLEQTLGQVEAQVDHLFVGQSHLAPQDADVQRERAYQTALTVDAQLETLESTLSSTLNELSLASSDDRSSQLMAVLNQHQDSLAAVEAATRQLELDVKHVGRMLQQSSF